MHFLRIYDNGLAQASYILGCEESGKALVVDPRRDVDVYLKEARRLGLTITAVTETHIHADFLSGARELAHATGALLYLSREGGPDWSYRGLDAFDNVGLRDLDHFEIGTVRVDVRHTPGHTPEHLCFLITDTTSSEEAMMMLSGDFVFVADLGRPDLLDETGSTQGKARTYAEQTFQSLKQTIARLPEHLQLWPGHGAGSACGKSLSSLPTSTIHYETQNRWWGRHLRDDDERGFIETLLGEQPEAPLYFSKMKQLNRDGMPILGGVPSPMHLTPGEFHKKTQEGGALLVDTRSAQEFAHRHIRGSFHVPAGYNFSSWAGWMLPYYRPLILLVDSSKQAGKLMRRLVRVGHDDVLGYVTHIDELAGKDQFATVTRIDVEEAQRLWRNHDAAFVDVRSKSEFREGHIPGARNVYAGRIVKELDRIPRDRSLVLYCSSGIRSSIATSALLAEGFENVINFAGSMQAWRAHELPEESEV